MTNKANRYSPVCRAVKYALASGLALGLYSTSALAQEAAAEEQKVEKIAVVGTRAAPRSIADSPVPVDINGGYYYLKGIYRF